MPVQTNRLVTIPLSPITGAVIGSITAFQHRFTCLQFFVRLFHAEPGTFPRSDSSICTYAPLGSHYSPVGLPVPVTQHGRSQEKFLLNHTDCALTHPGISTGSSFRPVHSRVRQSARQGEHSNHGRLVDPWLIGSTPHLWGAFAGTCCRYGCSRPLSRGSIQKPLQLMHARRGQAFQVVTPSFHLSNYQLSTQHALRVRQLLTAGERVALSQNGSPAFPSPLATVLEEVLLQLL